MMNCNHRENFFISLLYLKNASYNVQNINSTKNVTPIIGTIYFPIILSSIFSFFLPESHGPSAIKAQTKANTHKIKKIVQNIFRGVLLPGAPDFVTLFLIIRHSQLFKI